MPVSIPYMLSTMTCYCVIEEDSVRTCAAATIPSVDPASVEDKDVYRFPIWPVEEPSQSLYKNGCNTLTLLPNKCEKWRLTHPVELW